MGHAASKPATLDPVEGIVASMAPGRAGAGPPPDVFICHAGEQKRTVVDAIHKCFQNKHPSLDVFVDDWSLKPGDRAMPCIGAACSRAAVGVVVLSPEFVRKGNTMAELRILLQRCPLQHHQHQHQRSAPPSEDQRQASDQPEVQLVPVLYKMTVEEVKGMRALYDSQPWCVAERKPSPNVLDVWAADLQAITRISMIRYDQWRGVTQLAELVVEQVVQRLACAAQLLPPPPAALPLGLQLCLNQLQSMPDVYLMPTRPAWAATGQPDDAPPHPAELPLWQLATANSEQLVEAHVMPIWGDGRPPLAASRRLLRPGGGNLLRRCLTQASDLVLQQRQEDVRKLPAPVPTLVVHDHVTPPPTTALVGRQEELWQALQALDKWRYVQIIGGPGEGKSTLAQHVVQALCDQWRQLPQGAAAGQEAYALMIDLRGLGAHQDFHNALASRLLDEVGWSAAQGSQWPALLGRLRASQVAKAVILFENAEEGMHEAVQGFRDLLIELRSLPRVHLVVATRMAGLAVDDVPLEATRVELSCMGEADGMRLVEAHLGPGHAWAAEGAAEREAAQELVRLVECNPLVLTVAAGLVHSKQLSWQVVAKKARQGCAAINPKMQKKAGGMKNYMAALQVWLCSCLAEEEQQVLASVSVFAGSFTAAGAAAVSGVEEGEMPLDLQQDVSLFRRRRGSSSGSGEPGQQDTARFTMHALVREAAAQLHVDSAAEALSRRRFILWMLQHGEGPGQLLIRCAPGGEQPDTSQRLLLLCEELQNFAAAGAGLGAMGPGAEAGVLLDACRVAGVLSRCGHGHAARQLQGGAASVAEQLLGPQHPNTLSIKHGLADTLYRLGLPRHAKVLGEEVLQARARVLGPEHEATLSTKHDLALAVKDLGEAAEAMRLEEEMLAACLRSLGPEHLLTLSTQHNLAVSLRSKGKLGEARQMQEQVLQTRDRLLGRLQPDTLATKRHLAITLQEMGQLPEARRLEEEVLEDCNKVLGPEHPDTLSTKHKLAVTLMDMGQLQEASRVGSEVLQARARVLGPEHNATLTTKCVVALALSGLGQLGEARRMLEEVLETRDRVLAAQHPDTLATKRSLAITLQHMGELSEARQLLGEVLEAYTQLLGREHPDTLATKHDLAATLCAMGELVEAGRLLEEVLEERTRVLGVQHPDTLITERKLPVLSPTTTTTTTTTLSTTATSMREVP